MDGVSGGKSSRVSGNNSAVTTLHERCEPGCQSMSSDGDRWLHYASLWTTMFSFVVVAALTAGLAVLFLPHENSTRFGDEINPEVPPVLRLLSRRELSLYNGERGSKGLYLAILGQVFDVYKGYKHYGPGGAYHAFAGRDASLAFITGDFTERGLTDDVSSLSPLQVVNLYDWLAFYQRDYQTVGVVTGQFYNETGHRTEELLKAEASLAEGKQIKAKTEQEKTQFPTCNSEWSPASGGRVWCSTKSGGVKRDWIGVPRRLFSPGSSGLRCVCVKDSALANPNLQAYDGCPSKSESCFVKD